MVRSAKPAIRKWPFIIKCVLGLILGFFAVGCIYSSVATADRYRVVSEYAVEIQAVITHVETVTDTENGDTYDAMMRYRYEGKTYTGMYQNYSRSKDANAMVGETVTIYIDPTSPGDTMKEILNSGRSNMTIGAGLLVFFMMLISIRHRHDHVQTYGWHRETVKKDMIRYIWSGSKFYVALVPTLVYFAVKLTSLDVYELFWGDLLFLIPMVISLLFVPRFIRRLRMVHRDQFYMTRDTFVSKEEDSDSESTSYYVTYRNRNGTWKKSVSYRYYLGVREGDTVESAFLEGEKKPVLSYSGNLGVL